MMAEAFLCDMCHRLVDLYASYVLKIEVVAEPSVPPVSREDLESTDYAREIARLLEAAQESSPRELQDGVYRRFHFRLCAACQRRYLENPLPPA